MLAFSVGYCTGFVVRLFVDCWLLLLPEEEVLRVFWSDDVRIEDVFAMIDKVYDTF